MAARLDRRVKGLCANCGCRPIVPDFSQCQYCLDKLRARHMAKTGKPITPNTRSCEWCGQKGHRQPPCPPVEVDDTVERECARCTDRAEPGSLLCKDHEIIMDELSKEGWVCDESEDID